MTGYGYYGGMFAPVDKIKIPLTDRSYFFGDAVYEVCIGKDKKVYQLKEHICRLINSASAMNLTLPQDFYNLENIASAIIQKGGYPFFTLYIQLSRLGDKREHSFGNKDRSSLLVAVFPSDMPKPQEVSVRTENDKRYFYCDVKTVNLIPAVLSSAKAKKEGYDETVYERNGLITECSHSNLIIYKDETLKSAPPSESVLPGITRATVFDFARKSNIEASEEFFTKEEMLLADEIFITSTTKLIRRVREIDEKKVGGKAPEIYNLLWESLFEDFSRT